MTRLVVSIAEADPKAVVQRARRALANGADLVEIRLDALATTDSRFANLESLPRGRWIATLRTRAQGGQSESASIEQVRRLEHAVAAGAGYVDVEVALLDAVGDGATPIKSFDDLGDATPILSWHDFERRPDDVDALFSAMQAAVPGCIGKVAWQAHDASDNFAALAAVRNVPERRIAICMGAKGLLSRVLAHKCGAFATFCAADEGALTAPGQAALSVMRDLYRCHRHSSATRVFGVIGSPVTHSLSPVLFNDQFARDGLDAVYLPIQVDTTCELNRFLDGCRTRDWLDVAGFSVTVPHKTAALKWHRSQADALAERLGAANTLTFKAGRVTATNTDYVGAKASFSDWAVAAGAELSGMSAAVLGAGGVARAVVAALQDAGCEVTVFNRTAERAEVLAREFGSNIGQWDRRADAEADIVVNCTKLGMWPDVEVSPLPGDALGSNRVVFDTVYNPAETRLLRDARRAGCAVIDGVSMFIQQAAAQYRLWFEREMDTERARSIVSQALSGWSAQTDGPQS